VFENGSKNYETIHLVNSFNNVVQQTSNNSNAQQQINTEPNNVQQANTNKRKRSKSAPPFDNKVFSLKFASYKEYLKYFYKINP
jgi:hypothetical protein